MCRLKLLRKEATGVEVRFLNPEMTEGARKRGLGD